MINFSFYSPTKVIFGKGTENQVGSEIRHLGFKKVLVHYGGSSAQKSGLLDRVQHSINKEGIEFIMLGGVKPNPRLSKVREGIQACKDNKIEFILAVGGGSVIDSSKAIAYGVANPDVDVWDFYLGKAAAKACLPVGSILTIAAAGSETSNSSVITNEDGNHKRPYNYDLARPKFAIMNPELTYTLPTYQTMSGVVDILMHTMDRYFTPDKNGELIDGMSEALLRTVMHNGYKLRDNPNNYDARAEIMWAGSLSHNGLTGTGRNGDFSSHQLEHELSGMFDVTHGAGLSAIWPSWARYVYKSNPARFAQFAVNVAGCPMNFDKPEETAKAGIVAMERYFRDIEMPITIGELGLSDITDAQIIEMAKKCSWDGTRIIGQLMKLAEDDMIKIYQMAK